MGIFYVQGSEVQDNHRLIETGPYALVRHPLFTAYFMMVIGIIFCNPSVVTVLLLIGVYFYLGMWMRKDEATLLHELPGYEAYMTRMNRYFPSPAMLVHWLKTTR